MLKSIYCSRKSWLSNYEKCKNVGINVIFATVNFFYDKFSGYTSKELSSGYSLLTMSFDSFNQSFKFDKLGIIPVAVIGKQEIKSFTMNEITTRLSNDLLSFSSGKIIFFSEDGVKAPKASLLIIINNGLTGDSPGRAEFVGSRSSGHCVFCLTKTQDYTKSLLGTYLDFQVNSKRRVTEMLATNSTILNRNIVLEDEIKKFKEKYLIKYVSNLYYVPSSPLPEIICLDFMHSEVIGWIKCILF